MYIEEKPFSKEIIENVKNILEKYYDFHSVYINCSYISEVFVIFKLVNKKTKKPFEFHLHNWEQELNKILVNAHSLKEEFDYGFTDIDVKTLARKAGKEIVEYIRATTEYRLPLLTNSLEIFYCEERFGIKI
jgi:hypothetical protein